MDDLLFESDEGVPPHGEPPVTNEGVPPSGEPVLIPVDNALTKEEYVELRELLDKHGEVFVAKPAGAARVEPMAITYKDGWQDPPMEPPRVYAPRVEAAIEKEIDKQLQLGVIELSGVDRGCPVHAVAKPDSDTGYRFTLDMRQKNPGIVTNPYPLPLISDILSELRTAKYFAKMDLKYGFWQFPVRPEDMDKITFAWKGRIYRYRVVCMGNVDSVFYLQRTMVRLLSRSHLRGSLVYLDDVHVYGSTWREFIRVLGEVLGIFIDANLCLKAEKCAFGAREMCVLGHLVSRDGIRMADERRDAITSMPFPRNVRELRRFLGMTNYMRDYIPRYSLLAKPLTREVNNPPGSWPLVKMGEAFEELKRAVAAQLSLSHLDYGVPLVVQCDASILGIGGALINRYPDRDRVIKCVSHAFTEAESRWKTLEQEAFAVVFTVLFFRTVLFGQFFLVETDHRNLTFVHAGTSAKVIRWSLALQRFSFGISFIPGEQNVIADALSRAPAGAPRSLHAIRLSDFVAGPSASSRGSQRGAGGCPSADGSSLGQQSRGALALCPVTLRKKTDVSTGTRQEHAVKKSAEVSTGASQEHAGTSTERTSTGGLIPQESSASERKSWFDSVHNETQGHLGLHATLRVLQDRRWVWPRMSRDVAGWIASCALCQKYRLGGKDIVSIPSPITSYQIFEELGIDFVGPLPKDDVENSYILNCVCLTTHYCELFAVEAATAVIAAHCLLSVVARYGCFRSVRSDRGTHFVNEVIAEFLRLFEIQQVLTLAERPQANGVVERNGGEVMRHLRLLVAPKDLRSLWSVMLPLAQRIINNTWKAAIGNTPHRLIHWAPTNLDRGLFTPIDEPTVVPPLSNDYVVRLQTAYERLLDETSAHILEEQEKLQRGNVGMVPTGFPDGSYVLLSYNTQPPSKLSARWAGPFRVVSRKANKVVLEDLTGGKSRSVDVSRLKPFLVGSGVDPPKLAAADLGEAGVDAVLAHRGDARKRATLEFQIQWTDGEVTWQKWDDVKKLAAIDEYVRAFPGRELKGLLGKSN